MITRSTLEAMFDPKNKAMIKRLKKLNYTDEDLKSVDSFYKLLSDCPECRLLEKANKRLQVQANTFISKEYIDKRLDRIEQALEGKEKTIHFGGKGCRKGGACLCGYHTEDFTEWSNFWERVTCDKCKVLSEGKEREK